MDSGKISLSKKINKLEFKSTFRYMLRKALRLKVPSLDFTLLYKLRNGFLGNLTDASHLETDLLPSLGFNNELLHEFPSALYDHCGKGLYHWQYPNQFSKYLVFLSKFNISSYMEIGVRAGGTFVITVEYLNRFSKINRAVAVDIIPGTGLKKYEKINSAARYLKMYSNSKEFKEFVAGEESFDLVLIDGDHSEEACRADVQNIRDKARILVLHDIVSGVCPGVVKVWNELKTNHADEYDFYEFTDQYVEVQERLGMDVLGIGVAVRKDCGLERSEPTNTIEVPKLTEGETIIVEDGKIVQGPEVANGLAEESTKTEESTHDTASSETLIPIDEIA